MKNPRGNPEVAKYHFTTDRAEPCTAHLSLRIPPSLKANLKEIDNWQEFVRKTLTKAIEAKSA